MKIDDYLIGLIMNGWNFKKPILSVSMDFNIDIS